jgi:hypothetical protein
MIIWSIITLTKHLPNSDDSAAPSKDGAGSPEIAELRECLEVALERLDAAGAALHPVMVAPMERMAEILGVDWVKAVSGNAPKPASE